MSTKIIAHRGWAKGNGENTISAFKRASSGDMNGVEFDIRRHGESGEIIVSHNATVDTGVLTFKEALEYLKRENLELFLEFKEYSDKLFGEVADLLESHGLKDKSVIFGFWKVASKFPFTERRGFKLGIISYPWNIKKDIMRFNPDFIMMGYTSFLSKVAFRLYWSVFSLSSVFRKYPDKRFVIGVLQSGKEREWILKEEGLYAVTLDNPL
ncbi:MAG: hypothetical protein COU71_01145 [Parcubacteria group bacterium CG10_big_fil_rev_8_21_14_0_10_38_31]|nr:MAG: hypothetical protein COU71_01145 [Parcubacteria group bacterium CG10_big_fil_rev_8_21_14_0_10_38_31]